MADAATFRARGEGGVEWEFDVPEPGSLAEERFVDKIRKAELTVEGDNPFEHLLKAPGPVTGGEQVEGGAAVPLIVEGTTIVGPEIAQPVEAVIPPVQADPLAEKVAVSVERTGAVDARGSSVVEIPAVPQVDPLPEPVAPVLDAELEVPAGTVDEVLAWVDGDPERAQVALDAELEKGDGARKTLVEPLEPLVE